MKYAKGGMPESKMMKKEGRGMAKADMQKKLAKHAAMPASKAHAGLKSGGKVKKMMDGGDVPMAASRKRIPDRQATIADRMVKPARMAYKSGGSIDGCATKGKTKGTMVKMAKGGKTC